MADMMFSAIFHETVSRGFSLVLGNREDRASKERNIERVKMAHYRLQLADERTREIPIIEAPLRRQRGMIKRAREECGVVLHEHERKVRVVQDEEEAEQGVTGFSSLPRKIIRVVKSSVLPLLSPDEDELTLPSAVERFEWYADQASRFEGDVQSSSKLGSGKSLQASRFEGDMQSGSKLGSGKSLKAGFEEWPLVLGRLLKMVLGHLLAELSRLLREQAMTRRTRALFRKLKDELFEMQRVVRDHICVPPLGRSEAIPSSPDSAQPSRRAWYGGITTAWNFFTADEKPRTGMGGGYSTTTGMGGGHSTTTVSSVNLI